VQVETWLRGAARPLLSGRDWRSLQQTAMQSLTPTERTAFCASAHVEDALRKRLAAALGIAPMRPKQAVFAHYKNYGSG